VFRFEGQVSVFYAKEGPCYRCLFPAPPPPGLVPSCADGGVLGVLPGTIGTLQATEAIKLIVGFGQPLIGRLLLYDAVEMTFDTIKLRKDPNCPICGEHPTQTHLIDYEEFCGVPAHDHSAYVEGGTPVRAITVDEVRARLDAGDDLLILDVREPQEWQISLIDGTLRIPKGEILHHLDELPRDRDIVVHCKTGVRSGEAIRTLQAQGYTRLYNMAGGINAWARKIDPSLPTY
jgi:rhodanese-related sulfurtransferase